MAEVVLFHHALGLTPGVVAFADDLRQAGHTVHTPDLFEGRTFGSIDEGMGYAQQIGFPDEVIARGVRAVEGLPAGLVYAGFSLGVLPAQLLAQTRPGTIEYFLTERYCLFTRDALGRLQRADIHHIPWPLEEAEAEITQNDLAAHIGLTLPDSKPLLHYSRHLAVYVWPAELVLAKVVAAGPVVATAQ